MKRLNKLLSRKKAKPEEILKDSEELEKDEKEMIEGIFALSDSTVKEVMVPRIDVVFLKADSPEKELYRRVVDSGFSRFPVYEETIDNVIGVLYVKDLFPQLSRGEHANIRAIMRPPYYVPESMKLDSLLKEFKLRKVHIAIVVDEYGGISGIVCMEDIIEEIVGDIQDEFDNEEEEILKIDEGIFLCDAKIDLDDLNEQLKLNLPEDEFDTLGGFVFDLFGKIPVRQEKMEYESISFIIQKMEGRTIRKIKIILPHEEM